MKTAFKVVGLLGLIAVLWWWFSSAPARTPEVDPEGATRNRDAQAQAVMEPNEGRMVTNFGAGQAESDRWRSVDDTVMGGVSQSTFSVTPEGIGVFSGELSLENNGGFTSVRRAADDVDFAGARAIALRIKSDGRPYQLRLKTDNSNNSVSYKASFDVPAGEWTTVQLAIPDFEPVFRGRVIADAPALAPADIQQIGFLLADQQPGSFRLETDWIKLI
ncbi:MAG: CIA30 family protein [Phormidesmis sp.]